MFSEFSHWNRVSGAYCHNNEKHSTKLGSLTECKILCLERDSCTGVSFSSFDVHHFGKSNCLFCRENVTETYEVFYDTFIRPGNPESIFFQIC